MADHVARKAQLRFALRLAGLDDAAVAQHGERIADGQHFVQLVGYENDGNALAFERSHQRKHTVNFHLRQGSGGLVHDDDGRLHQKRAGDFDDLLIGRVQLAHHRARVKIDLHARKHLARSFDHVLAPQKRPLLFFAADEKVFINGQIVDEIQFLMNERDARVHGITRGGKDERLAVQRDFARVRTQHAAENVHQRALSSAVFADQRVNFALLQREGHIFQYLVSVECLFDARHGQRHGLHLRLRLTKAGHDASPWPAA